jgi:hypothetical protein
MLVAQTGGKSYIRLLVEPGTHVIKSVAENDSEITIDAYAGMNHFIWQEVKMGVFYARNQLKIVDEDTGRKGVAECKLVQNNF